MPFKAVIFDLDGTLLDTLQDLANSYNRVLKKMGFPTHLVDAYRYFVGEGARVCMTRALPAENRDVVTIDTSLQMFLDDYAQNWNIYTKPYKGIPEMLKALSELDLKMAILSNKPQEDTEKCVKKFLSNWKFEVIFGQKDSVPKKPDPTAALEISRLLGVLPEEFFFIGDTPIDMKTATAAGMVPFGVLWGFRSIDELIKSGARATIKTATDIPSLVRC
ncbi:MAG: HAD family hydrolase [Deltaproteobacteria bacterium]|nr:HAD family hydrolase [Deltaproteobacteria bacterium]MBW1983291.1 HAD family hydrolase [Deltaproteobacteria bacterium]MBW2180465.1 HAD family hydrolase [Deltaproteobacteria bacterium]